MGQIEQDLPEKKMLGKIEPAYVYYIRVNDIGKSRRRSGDIEQITQVLQIYYLYTTRIGTY